MAYFLGGVFGPDLLDEIKDRGYTADEASL